MILKVLVAGQAVGFQEVPFAELGVHIVNVSASAAEVTPPAQLTFPQHSSRKLEA